MYFHTPSLTRALNAACRPPHFNPRHLFISTAFLLLFGGLRSAIEIGRLLDRFLYPDYTKQNIGAPIYIIGNPRSGTTYLHRLMSADDRFTYFRLFQTIFPAICFYRGFEKLAAVDGRLNRPLGRLLEKISAAGFKGWQGIHQTGPNAVESDEMLFVYAFLSPIVTMQFPFFDDLHDACFADDLPACERQKGIAYYRDCLRRHLYATGPKKILLQKVALIAGRLKSIVSAVPNIRLVHLVRHPYQSVPSLMSMFTRPWKALAPQAYKNPRYKRDLVELIFGYYRSLLSATEGMPPSRHLVIRYENLVTDPAATVAGIYRRFDLPLTDEHRRYLQKAAAAERSYQSRHRYSLAQFGLNKELVHRELKPVFDAYGFTP